MERSKKVIFPIDQLQQLLSFGIPPWTLIVNPYFTNAALLRHSPRKYEDACNVLQTRPELIEFLRSADVNAVRKALEEITEVKELLSETAFQHSENTEGVLLEDAPECTPSEVLKQDSINILLDDLASEVNRRALQQQAQDGNAELEKYSENSHRELEEETSNSSNCSQEGPSASDYFTPEGGDCDFKLEEDCEESYFPSNVEENGEKNTHPCEENISDICEEKNETEETTEETPLEIQLLNAEGDEKEKIDTELNTFEGDVTISEEVNEISEETFCVENEEGKAYETMYELQSEEPSSYREEGEKPQILPLRENIDVAYIKKVIAECSMLVNKGSDKMEKMEVESKAFVNAEVYQSQEETLILEEAVNEAKLSSAIGEGLVEESICKAVDEVDFVENVNKETCEIVEIEDSKNTESEETALLGMENESVCSVTISEKLEMDAENIDYESGKDIEAAEEINNEHKDDDGLTDFTKPISDETENIRIDINYCGSTLMPIKEEVNERSEDEDCFTEDLSLPCSLSAELSGIEELGDDFKIKLNTDEDISKQCTPEGSEPNKGSPASFNTDETEFLLSESGSSSGQFKLLSDEDIIDDCFMETLNQIKIPLSAERSKETDDIFKDEIAKILSAGNKTEESTDNAIEMTFRLTPEISSDVSESKVANEEENKEEYRGLFLQAEGLTKIKLLLDLEEEPVEEAKIIEKIEKIVNTSGDGDLALRCPQEVKEIGTQTPDKLGGSGDGPGNLDGKPSIENDITKNSEDLSDISSYNEITPIPKETFSLIPTKEGSPSIKKDATPKIAKDISATVTKETSTTLTKGTSTADAKEIKVNGKTENNTNNNATDVQMEKKPAQKKLTFNLNKKTSKRIDIRRSSYPTEKLKNNQESSKSVLKNCSATVENIPNTIKNASFDLKDKIQPKDLNTTQDGKKQAQESKPQYRREKREVEKPAPTPTKDTSTFKETKRDESNERKPFQRKPLVKQLSRGVLEKEEASQQAAKDKKIDRSDNEDAKKRRSFGDRSVDRSQKPIPKEVSTNEKNLKGTQKEVVAVARATDLKKGGKLDVNKGQGDCKSDHFSEKGQKSEEGIGDRKKNARNFKPFTTKTPEKPPVQPEIKEKVLTSTPHPKKQFGPEKKTDKHLKTLNENEGFTPESKANKEKAQPKKDIEIETTTTGKGLGTKAGDTPQRRWRN